MAIVVLFSTMSFTVDMHYCGDSLVDSAILHKAENCGMKMQNPSSEDCNITIKDCCSDKQISIDGQVELNISIDTLTFDQQFFVALFVYSYSNIFEELEENITLHRDYTTPPVIRQIYKLDETYII